MKRKPSIPLIGLGIILLVIVIAVVVNVLDPAPSVIMAPGAPGVDYSTPSV